MVGGVCGKGQVIVTAVKLGDGLPMIYCLFMALVADRNKCAMWQPWQLTACFVLTQPKPGAKTRCP